MALIMNPVPFWKSSFLWIFPSASILCLYYASQMIDPAYLTGHREGAAAVSALLLMISCPAASVVGAWEGGRFRAARPLLHSASRSAGQQIMPPMLIAALTGSLVQLFGSMVLLARAGEAPDAVPWEVLTVLMAVPWVHAAGGLLLGFWLPRVAAPALAMAASYVVIGFAWTLPLVPLRYMAGTGIGLCCTAAQHLDGRAVMAAALWSLGGTAALLLLALVRHLAPATGLRPRLTVLGSVAVVLLAAVGAGLGAAHRVGPEPTQPYSAQASDCVPGSPTVCLNPVQRSREDVAPAIRGVFASLQAAGMPTVSMVTALGQGEALRADGTADLAIDPRMDATEAVHSAASTYASATDAAQCSEDSWWRARMVFAAWLDATAARSVLGEPESDAAYARVRDSLSGDAAGTGELETFLGLGERERAQWARTFYDGWGSCTVPPLPDRGASS